MAEPKRKFTRELKLEAVFRCLRIVFSGGCSCRLSTRSIVRRASERAAMKYEWSNGMVEGEINRLKSIKRETYGHASCGQHEWKK